jgi:hypothetical protein
VPVQEKEERGSRAAAGRFTLPSSLREADDGRFDDPEEVGGAMPSRSKLRVSTVSPPLPPRRASADDELPGRGRGKRGKKVSEAQRLKDLAAHITVGVNDGPRMRIPVLTNAGADDSPPPTVRGGRGGRGGRGRGRGGAHADLSGSGDIGVGELSSVGPLSASVRGGHGRGRLHRVLRLSGVAPAR